MSGLMTRSRATSLARSGSYPEDQAAASDAMSVLRECKAASPTRPRTRQSRLYRDKRAPRVASDCQNVKVVTNLSTSAESAGNWSSISPQKKACVAVPSLSPDTDHVLTFLQSARERGIPVRFGKWSPEEDRYLRKLVALFATGVLADVPTKSSMRAWLARMLNCCPMRISKKQMHGEKFRGKTKFQKNAARIENMTQDQYDTSCEETSRLRAQFLKTWAKDEFTRRNVNGRADNFDEWYNKVLALVPTPVIAKNAHIVESGKRSQPDTPCTLRREIQEECKRRKLQASTIELAYNKKHALVKTEEQREPEQEGRLALCAGWSQPLCNDAQSTTSYNHDAIVCGPVVHGDWLSSPSGDYQFVNYPAMTYVNDRRYARQSCIWYEDTFQYAVCTNAEQQQHPSAGLVPSQKGSRLLIDVGPPSSWSDGAGGASMDSSPPDCLQWSENDLMDDLAMLTEPGLASWEDMLSPATMFSCSPTQW